MIFSARSFLRSDIKTTVKDCQEMAKYHLQMSQTQEEEIEYDVEMWKLQLMQCLLYSKEKSLFYVYSCDSLGLSWSWNIKIKLNFCVSWNVYDAYVISNYF